MGFPARFNSRIPQIRASVLNIWVYVGVSPQCEKSSLTDSWDPPNTDLVNCSAPSYKRISIITKSSRSVFKDVTKSPIKFQLLLTVPIPVLPSISRDKQELLANWQRLSTTDLVSFTPFRFSAEKLQRSKI